MTCTKCDASLCCMPVCSYCGVIYKNTDRAKSSHRVHCKSQKRRQFKYVAGATIPKLAEPTRRAVTVERLAVIDFSSESQPFPSESQPLLPESAPALDAPEVTVLPPR